MNYKIGDILDGNYKHSIIILQYLLDYKRSQVLLKRNQILDDQVISKFKKIQDDLATGRPLQYCIGKWNFYGYDFKVNENVLIPRPETELLVERILKEDLKGKKILDLGTGSGAIAISLYLEAKQIHITASDISIEAIHVAKENANEHDSKINFVESDLFDNINDKFDIIVSNPPYLSEEEYSMVDDLLYHEPKRALLAGPKGYEIYEKIIDQSPYYLRKNGLLFLEIGYQQRVPILELMEENGFRDVEVIKDYGGKDRIIVGRHHTMI